MEVVNWIVTLLGASGGLIGALYGGLMKWKLNKAEANKLNSAVRETEIDATVKRLSSHLDRVEREHNEDRANLAKLHEDYMVVRDKLSEARERNAVLESELKKRAAP